MPAHRSQSCNNIAAITKSLVLHPQPEGVSAPSSDMQHPPQISSSSATQIPSPSGSSVSSQRSGASSSSSPLLRPSKLRGSRSLFSSPDTSPALTATQPSTSPSAMPPPLQASKSALRESSLGSYWKNKKNRSVSWDDIPGLAASTLAGVSEEHEEASEEPGSLCRTPSNDSSDSTEKGSANWQPDKEAKTCALSGCGRRFGPIHRKHHCRQCGKVVCGPCSKGRIQNQRACNVCVQSRRSSICEDSEVSDDQYAESAARIPPVQETNDGTLRGYMGSSEGGELDDFAEALKGAGFGDGDIAAPASVTSPLPRSNSANAMMHMVDRSPENSPQKGERVYSSGSLSGPTTPKIAITNQEKSSSTIKKSSSAHSLKHLLWPRFTGSDEAEEDKKVPSSPRGGGWISALRGTGTFSRNKAVEEVTEEKDDFPIKAVYNGGLYIMDSRTPKPDQNSMKAKQVLPIPNQEFVWSGTHAMDAQGLIYFLATAGGTDRWINPVESEIVKVTGTRWKLGQISDVVNTRPHIKTDSWSEPVEGAWFCVELPTGIALQPSHYSIRHGFGGGAQLRNWSLLASSDGENWTVLSQHVNDNSLIGGYAVHTWPINAEIDSARMFKIQMTGGNDIQGFQLSCCGLEFYGRIIAPATEGILRPNHWLFADP